MLLNPAVNPMPTSTGENPAHHRKRRREDSRPPSDKKVTSEHDALAKKLEKPNNAALRLLGLLLQCAERVAVENLHGAAQLLPQITNLSCPFGSPAQRVGAYFSNALQARVLASHLGNPNSIAPTPISHIINLQNALQTHNSLTPLIKFSHFTANQAILQALEGQEHVHIIDLDIMQGLQWPGLFHMLASKRLRSLRITGLGPSSEALETTGQRLSQFAKSLNIPFFQFTAVEGKIGNLDDVSRLNIRSCNDEAVIVHWMHHSLYDVTGNDLRALRLLTLIRPRLITIVEQDLSRGGSFLERFVEALHYYSALFDALGDGFEKDDHYRHVVERQVLGVEIRNLVSLGGANRAGEVKIERWSDELVRVGFRPVPLGGCPAKQASMLLGMFRPWKGYTLVEEENGSLKLGWKDLSLLTAMAWEPSCRF